MHGDASGPHDFLTLLGEILTGPLRLAVDFVGRYSRINA